MAEELAVKSFREHIVWQRSIDLCEAIYGFTKTFPSDELYGLRSQLRRASVSIPSNIAEGFGRKSTGELIQFACIARGSNLEVQTQLVIAKRLRFGMESNLLQCEQMSIEVGRRLNSWINSLKDRQNSR